MELIRIMTSVITIRLLFIYFSVDFSHNKIKEFKYSLLRRGKISLSGVPLRLVQKLKVGVATVGGQDCRQLLADQENIRIFGK